MVGVHWKALREWPGVSFGIVLFAPQRHGVQLLIELLVAKFRSPTSQDRGLGKQMRPIIPVSDQLGHWSRSKGHQQSLCCSCLFCSAGCSWAHTGAIDKVGLNLCMDTQAKNWVRRLGLPELGSGFHVDFSACLFCVFQLHLHGMCLSLVSPHNFAAFFQITC